MTAPGPEGRRNDGRKRLLQAYPHRYGPGKIHAATMQFSPLWGYQWLPICTGEPIHANDPVDADQRQLLWLVTCKRCLAMLWKADRDR